ncbi:sulfite oxidase isoform X2 [Orussus abietinus]|uniref:sulfite oxidase isoform X2 n=1 Tax=Orussus abietinus TaxID=222816 RepID=UPI000625039E|nr:sulfite oxidase isoform X2 [Orussus abietinus]
MTARHGFLSLFESIMRSHRNESTRILYYKPECTRGNESGGYSKYNSYSKYIGSIAVALSTVGVYYLTNSGLRRAYAHEKERDVRCGEIREDLRTYTLEEVGKHDNKKTGIWVTFKHGVYNITDFVDKHPGGPSKIMMAAGGSIEPFWMMFANHNNKEIHALLESMRIGNLSEEDVNHATDGMDDPYAWEPKRHKALIINGHKPFCAETPPSLLVKSFTTPGDLFYVRHHLPVPKVDVDDYELEIAIEETTVKKLKFEDLKSLPKCTITSTIMCAGNRRSEMAKEKPLKGLSWGVGAVGNATWTGVRLCDLLNYLGVNENDYDHVQFEGLDLDSSGMPYGASIPISKAMDPRGDVILAYKMNDQPIPRDHGFPIRVIVPGVVGARNVKWLAKITVSKEECQSQWQQGDYKAFSSSIDWHNVDFSSAPAIQELPVNSAICSPEPGERVKVKDNQVTVEGYAWSGGGRGIIRVDVSIDKGETWQAAKLIQDPTAKQHRHWSWTLWSIDLPVDVNTTEAEIWVKAVDSSYNVQPESVKHIWNLRGFLCNSFHKVKDDKLIFETHLRRL